MIPLLYGFCFLFPSFVDLLDWLNPLFLFSFAGLEFIDSIFSILVFTFMCHHKCWLRERFILDCVSIRRKVKIKRILIHLLFTSHVIADILYCLASWSDISHALLHTSAPFVFISCSCNNKLLWTLSDFTQMQPDSISLWARYLLLPTLGPFLGPSHSHPGWIES